MLIDLLKLPKEGERVDLTFKEMFCSSLFDITSFQGEIYKEKEMYIIQGNLKFEIEEQCDRCLENFTLSIDENLFVKLTNKSNYKYNFDLGEVQLDEDDLNVIYIEDSLIDINTLILQEAESMRPLSKLCIKTCKGLCKHCGANLNVVECNCKENYNEYFSIADLMIKNKK
jgi:uncharacterized protein